MGPHRDNLKDLLWAICIVAAIAGLLRMIGCRSRAPADQPGINIDAERFFDTHPHCVEMAHVDGLDECTQWDIFHPLLRPPVH